MDTRCKKNARRNFLFISLDFLKRFVQFKSEFIRKYPRVDEEAWISGGERENKNSGWMEKRN